jgi:GMP synthase (glutamine-hydrolysing)
MEKILILDFGSQTTALIGRRIREMGVYTEIIAGDSPLEPRVLEDVVGIILSGSPESVYANGAKVDKVIYSLPLPLLGICYGVQLMTSDLGGEVHGLQKKEYGAMSVTLEIPPTEAGKSAAGFFDELRPQSWSSLPFQAWMSHGDTLTALAPGFNIAGKSENGFPALVYSTDKPYFGLQFHPEVSHCEHGSDFLRAFVFGACRATPSWSMEQYAAEIKSSLKTAVGNRNVLLLISGGVDSTVVGGLLLKTLPRENVHLMYIDTGLMRKNETAEVEEALKALGAINLHIVHAEHEFLSALSGKDNPEEKRRIIGDAFIRIQEREVERLNLGEDYLLAQGTLYTDLIESGKGVGQKAQKIKSHHNVASPLVEALRNAGRIIEPLDKLYKDEVRALGRLLGIRANVVDRHPFPGPGLAVRVLGEVTKEKCDILREADAVYIGELKKRGLYDKIWQAFAVLLPLRSVGVAGDERHYGYVLALRAVTSHDGMTADVFPFPPSDLLEISTLITNNVSEIGRVTYDISSKPPATIEWE